MGDERTLRDDPAFTIRMMVDVAIKALSPAVNDPTTAVQALHRIEDLLRYAAAKHLSAGVVTDGTGVIRLVYPTPTWEDLVELALDEIRAFGAGQYQVAWRLRALLDALIADLPEHRPRPWEAQVALLADAVGHSYSQTQRAAALVPDRQGLGMSRRGAGRWTLSQATRARGLLRREAESGHSGRPATPSVLALGYPGEGPVGWVRLARWPAPPSDLVAANGGGHRLGCVPPASAGCRPRLTAPTMTLTASAKITRSAIICPVTTSRPPGSWP